MHSTLTPKQVESLCYKKVVGFSYGSGPHILAFTECGDLYSWGHNGYCQLGNGSTNQGLTPAIIQNSLLGRKVVEVSQQDGCSCESNSRINRPCSLSLLVSKSHFSVSS